MMRWTRTLLPINLKISVWKLGKTCCHNKTAKVSAILLSFEIQSNRVFSVLSPREISFQCLFYANWHDFRLFFLIESKIPCLSSRCLLHGLICILYPARCPSALPQRVAPACCRCYGCRLSCFSSNKSEMELFSSLFGHANEDKRLYHLTYTRVFRRFHFLCTVP